MLRRKTSYLADIKESTVSEDQKVVCVAQTEHIRRAFWVSVPKSMEDDRIEELFFEQDVGGRPHHGEKYEVNLDLNLPNDTDTIMPRDVEPYEIEEDDD